MNTMECLPCLFPELASSHLRLHPLPQFHRLHNACCILIRASIGINLCRSCLCKMHRQTEDEKFFDSITTNYYYGVEHRPESGTKRIFSSNRGPPLIKLSCLEIPASRACRAGRARLTAGQCGHNVLTSVGHNFTSFMIPAGWFIHQKRVVGSIPPRATPADPSG